MRAAIEFLRRSSTSRPINANSQSLKYREHYEVLAQLLADGRYHRQFYVFRYCPVCRRRRTALWRRSVDNAIALRSMCTSRALSHPNCRVLCASRRPTKIDYRFGSLVELAGDDRCTAADDATMETGRRGRRSSPLRLIVERSTGRRRRARRMRNRQRDHKAFYDVTVCPWFAATRKLGRLLLSVFTNVFTSLFEQAGNCRQQRRPRWCHLANSTKHNVVHDSGSLAALCEKYAIHKTGST